MTLRLEEVLSCSSGTGNDGKAALSIAMHYNPNCSKNAYKSRDGYTRADVLRWMDALAWMAAAQSKSAGIIWRPPLKLTVGGTFKDGRACPDVHNFVIVVADSIQQGLGINDQQYIIETELPVIDPSQEPQISVKVIQE